MVPILGEDNLFEIEDGELRYRGAQLLVNEGLEKWKYLNSVIAPPPQDALELHKRSLIHHLHQEAGSAHLNPRYLAGQGFYFLETKINNT